MHKLVTRSAKNFLHYLHKISKLKAILSHKSKSNARFVFKQTTNKVITFKIIQSAECASVPILSI